ncbi:MAG: hypothetical protein AAB729_00270 [Patescibacteria group bacterium]
MKKDKTKVNKMLGQADLSAISDVMGGLLDKQSAVLRQDLASKKDLHDEISGVEVRLKEYMSEGFESVMEGMDALAEKLADKEKLERIVEWAITVGEKVGVRPKV